MPTLTTTSLAEQLTDCKNNVRLNPADSSHRVHLFQLCSVLGDWERALTQLNVCGELDPIAIGIVQVYTHAINHEATRASVFNGQTKPNVFGDVEPWISLLIEAVSLEAAGDHATAQAKRDEAFDQAPATSGELLTADETNHNFEWIADADTRLGPLFEAVIEGEYYWVSWEHVKAINVSPPSDLRDVVWTPVNIMWQDNKTSAAVIPTRYVESHLVEDDDIRVARKTEWNETPSGSYEGLGQRMLATDAGEFALMDVRKIEIN